MTVRPTPHERRWLYRGLALLGAAALLALYLLLTGCAVVRAEPCPLLPAPPADAVKLPADAVKLPAVTGDRPWTSGDCNSCSCDESGICWCTTMWCGPVPGLVPPPPEPER